MNAVIWIFFHRNSNPRFNSRHISFGYVSKESTLLELVRSTTNRHVNRINESILHFSINNEIQVSKPCRSNKQTKFKIIGVRTNELVSISFQFELVARCEAALCILHMCIWARTMDDGFMFICFILISASMKRMSCWAQIVFPCPLPYKSKLIVGGLSI